MQILGTPAKKTFKSIQHFEVLIPSNQYGVNVNIATVDWSKSTIENVSILPTGSTPISATASARYDTNTTINVYRLANDSDTVKVSFDLIEWNNIKSVQRGVASFSTTSYNTTVSSVDVAKSKLSFSGVNAYTSGYRPNKMKLESSTNLKSELVIGATAQNNYFLAEFK